MTNPLKGLFILAAILLAAIQSVPQAEASGYVVNGQRKLCVDIVKGIMKPGTPIIIWHCHGKAPQQIMQSDTSVVAQAAPHLCIDGAPKQQLRLAECKKVKREWLIVNGTVVSSDGTCWDVAGAKYVAGNKMLAWPCHQGANQKFVYFP